MVNLVLIIITHTLGTVSHEGCTAYNSTINCFQIVHMQFAFSSQLHDLLVDYLLSSERKNLSTLVEGRKLLLEKWSNRGSYIKELDELIEQRENNILLLENGILPSPPWIILPMGRKLFQEFFHIGSARFADKD